LTADFAQRHLYFPLYDTIPLLLDDIGWYSVTPQPIAAHIADRCQSDVIIDAFCGVGGNAIEFARTCERVIAIDNDPIRLRLARHNALHCGVADRIEFILADFTEWAHRRIERNLTEPQASTVDVIFLSPPWGLFGSPRDMAVSLMPGGPEYLSYGKTYPLSAVEPIPGDQLFEIAHKITPNLAYFLPKNVDLKELAGLAQTLDAPSQDGSQDQERQREWVEIEEEWVGDKLKAVTAYFGGLVAE
jgi:trimethylguanosine synthase